MTGIEGRVTGKVRLPYKVERERSIQGREMGGGKVVGGHNYRE